MSRSGRRADGLSRHLKRDPERIGGRRRRSLWVGDNHTIILSRDKAGSTGRIGYSPSFLRWTCEDLSLYLSVHSPMRMIKNITAITSNWPLERRITIPLRTLDDYRVGRNVDLIFFDELHRIRRPRDHHLLVKSCLIVGFERDEFVKDEPVSETSP